MVERSECLSHGAVHECCRGLAVSRGGNDAIRDVPRPTPGSPKSTHHVREVRPCVVKVCVVNGDHLSGQLAFNPALIVAVLGKGLLLGQDGVTSILWTGLASMRSAGGKHHVFEEGSKPDSAGLSVH